MRALLLSKIFKIECARLARIANLCLLLLCVRFVGMDRLLVVDSICTHSRGANRVYVRLIVALYIGGLKRNLLCW